MLLSNILHLITMAVLFCCVCAEQKLAWKSSTFPDPRKDFIQCGLRAPGTICDPEGILTEQEVFSLESFIEDAESSSKTVNNQSQDCRNSATGNALTGLKFYIALVNKVENNGAVVTLDVFKNFTKELKVHYSLSKSGECDKTVLIAVSKGDGRLFTLSGKDVLLSSATLDDAFARNKDRFTSGRYATGLTEMIAMITNAYKQAQRNAMASFRSSSRAVLETSVMTTKSGGTPTTLSQQLTTTVNGSSILSPAAQKLWLGILEATFKFFSDQFISIFAI